MRARILAILLLLTLLASSLAPVAIVQANPFNPRLAVQVASNGQFNMGAFPNPTTGGSTSGSWDLMYRWPGTPGTSFTTIRVDGLDTKLGISAAPTEPPADIDTGTNRSRWQIGDIEVTQLIEIVFNNQTGQEDAARISYAVRNVGGASHSVGSRVMIDTEINNNDGAIFRVPGVGLVTHEAEFNGANIPDAIQEFFGVNDNLHVAASTLKSGGATAPDRLVLARWPVIKDTAYDYAIDPNALFTSDSAYALFWNPAALAPGETRTYVTYYGLAQLTVDLRPPLALGVTGPATLSVVNGQYSPNPFDITATIYNNGSATATGVALTLNLPDELNLAVGAVTQFVGDLAPGDERQVFWSATPYPFDPSVETTLTYSVSASASNADPKTVDRQITIPPVGPPAGDCVTSAGAWANNGIAAQVGNFTAEFDASPGNAPMDGVIGFSAASAAAYTDLAAIVRFAPAGVIDARSGGVYQAVSQIPYIAGARYHFRLAIRIPSHTYDAYVTPPGRAEQTIGLNYTFRSQQSSVGGLGNLGLYAKSGSHQVCSLIITASGQTTYAVSGRVTDNTNAPLTGVTISSDAGRPAVTDSNGDYTLNGIGAGTYTLLPARSGYTFAPGSLAVSVPPSRSGLNFVGMPTSGGNCVTSAGTWQNTGIAAQTGSFMAQFDATPNSASMDGVIGFSANSATGYADLAAIVRFAPGGVIDARNGGAYQAAAQIPYTAGTSYHFRMVVHVPSHTYDAYVTKSGGAEQAIGLNYAFRTEQSGVGRLAKLALYAKSGSHVACGLAISGPPVTPTYTVVPIYPDNPNTSSDVMRGGTMYRYFRLVDANGAPIANATIGFSRGSDAVSDAQGVFAYVAAANALGFPGSYLIAVQRVTVNGQTVALNGQTTFGVEVSERRYTNAWSYGVSQRVKGGVQGYLFSENSGGMELKLEESDPGIVADDIVFLKEAYNAQTGAGVETGIKAEAQVAVVKLHIGATGGVKIGKVTQSSTATRYAHPYEPNDKEIQALFLLVSLIDTKPDIRNKPLVDQLLKLAIERKLPYGRYISEQEAGLGLKLAANASVDAEAKFGIKNGPSAGLKLTVVDAEASLSAIGTVTNYQDRNEWGLGVDSEYELDWSLLSASGSIGKFSRELGLWIGSRARRIGTELIFDRSTNQLLRLELSFTGDGNIAVLGSNIEETTVTVSIPASELGTDRLARAGNISRLLLAAQGRAGQLVRLGPRAMIDDLNGILSDLPFAEYDLRVEDGANYQVETGISLAFGVTIDLGTGVSVKQTRGLLREQGVFLYGQNIKTTSYTPDSSVARPGKSWGDLTLNALGGLWEFVKDRFNVVSQQVRSGISSRIEIVAHGVDGAIRGTARLFVPASSQIALRKPMANDLLLTGAATVTAVSWAPSDSASPFIVGGVYDLQPYDLVLDPAAALTISYTDLAAAGVDESRIVMLRWDPQGNHWQPIPGQADLAQNTFTATITQLGTYALGYDATPPLITLLDPVDGSRIANTLPHISALIRDAGMGVDPVSVQMQVDGQSVPAAYNIGTGEAAYLPSAELRSGVHRVTISARDIAGNSDSLTAIFTVGGTGTIYLPVIQWR